MLLAMLNMGDVSTWEGCLAVCAGACADAAPGDATAGLLAFASFASSGLRL